MQSKLFLPIPRVRYFAEESHTSINQSRESSVESLRFLASDWLKFVALPRKYRTLLLTMVDQEGHLLLCRKNLI